MKFKLLKDLPGIKAGTVRTKEQWKKLFSAMGLIENWPENETTPDFWSEWLEPIPEKWPKKGDWYAIEPWGGIVKFVNNPPKEEMLEFGNCFRTEQQAQKAADFLKDVLSGRLLKELRVTKKNPPFYGNGWREITRLIDKMKAFLEEE